MTAAGKTATGTLTLAYGPDDPSKPQHESYQLLFTDVKGHGNTRPIRYRIDVIRDLPPEVKFTSPEQEEVQVPADGGWKSASGRWTAISPCGGSCSARSMTAAAFDSAAVGQAGAGKTLAGPVPKDVCLRARPAGAAGRRPRRLLGRGRRQQGADGESLRDRASDDPRHRDRRRPPDTGPQPHLPPSATPDQPLPGDHEIPPQAERDQNPTPDEHTRNKGEQKTGQKTRRRQSGLGKCR